MVSQTTIAGFSVGYEENAAPGIEYLKNDLDQTEARVFFDQARTRGSAAFEDDEDRQFTLICKSNVYTLVRR